MNYIIISKDRHRDDIVYTFQGKYEEAKKHARKMLFKMRKYEFEENEYNDGNFIYSISMTDGDYAVEIYKPENLNDANCTKEVIK